VKTSPRYSCVHGTRYLYLAEGCRCRLCTAANTAYVPDWRHRSGRTDPTRSSRTSRDFTLCSRLPLRCLPGSQRRKRPASSGPQDRRRRRGSILIGSGGALQIN
jgi:hypothetical protein